MLNTTQAMPAPRSGLYAVPAPRARHRADGPPATTPRVGGCGGLQCAHCDPEPGRAPAIPDAHRRRHRATDSVDVHTLDALAAAITARPRP